MTILADIYADIRAEIPGIISPTALRMVRITAEDYFRVTNAWRFEESIAAVADQEGYTLLLAAIDVDVVVNKILTMTRSNVPLYPKSLEWINHNIPTWKTTSGTPAFFVQDSVRDFRVAPGPSDTTALVCEVSLRPRKATTVILDAVYEDHETALIHGTLARAFAMQNQSWTDINMATYHGGLYASLRDEAKKQAVMDTYSRPAGTAAYGGI